ncbi:BREX-2 system phosphatase PglZ [Propionibacteriaceae bacterium Y2011]
MADRRVTVQAAVPVAVVGRAMVRAIIDYVVERRYTSRDGAIGIRGRVAEPEQRFDHAGTPVRVVSCPSSLAAREVLAQRVPDEWLVIVTDRPESDLGPGVLTHLVGQQLRSPDPWQAVRQRFAATGIDAQLITRHGHRDLALGLLDVLPTDGWPPAPAGLLTRDHAFGAVARHALGLPDGPVDAVTVLGWSSRQATPGQLADLRTRGGDRLCDAVVAWLGAAAGDAAPAVTELLLAGRPGDLLPLGLAVKLLTDSEQRPAAELALARLSHRWTPAPDTAIRQLAEQTGTITGTLLLDARRRADAEQALARADQLLKEGQATHLTAESDLLGSGLEARFRELADALLGETTTSGDGIERAWRRIGDHALGETHPLRSAFHGAVRLSRWLADVDHGSSGAAGHRAAAFAGLVRRQLDVDGYVDAAVNDAAAGAADEHLGKALGHVLSLSRDARDAHDAAFAKALGDHGVAEFEPLTDTGGAVFPLERVLPDLVIPLARRSPVLLLVLDGLSTGVSVELFDDLINAAGARWQERLFAGQERRVAGVSVLPSITEVSRASLLAGRLTQGQQNVEHKAYGALTSAHGVAASLFHKGDLDKVRGGHSVADTVRAAIDDVERPLVTCVLNTIDDALDRSDPAGTHWSVDAVKHLSALLERARDAGRTVVITSDHGHVVERRQGYSRLASGVPGATRHRPVGGVSTSSTSGSASSTGVSTGSTGVSTSSTGAVAEDEILVRGDRVMTSDHTAVLAVNERLRYGPIKAGYHGGANPAEVVVPVIALVPSDVEQPDDVGLATPAEPDWWSGPTDSARRATRLFRATRGPSDLTLAQQPLLDEPEPAEPGGFGAAVVATPTYADQRTLAGRIAITDEQVVRLLDALSQSAHGRISITQVAKILGVAVARVPGAFEQLRRLLNVEGYSVVRRDPSTGMVILDEQLLREQFGVGR